MEFTGWDNYLAELEYAWQNDGHQRKDQHKN
jgi:hypothetical protein